MENASKALVMAGSVLLAIMMISLAIYLFSNFGGVTSQIEQGVEESQISQFNSQFTTNVGKNNVTIYDIVSMANLATQNNKQYGFSKQTATGNNYYIAVTLQGKGQIEFGVDTFNAELEAAGINEIVAEKQRQLDEFLATKGDSAEDSDASEVSSEASEVSSEAAE